MRIEANLHENMVVDAGRLLQIRLNINATLRYDNVDFMAFAVKPVEGS